MTNIITIISYARAALALSAVALLVARETHHAYQRLASQPLLLVDHHTIISVAGNAESNYGVQNLYCRADNGSFVPVVECEGLDGDRLDTGMI
ncbi:hypothetical protein F4820DRAFT_426624 [Hypoxylon rubiginosum]|uniref:Uncharacterized protein n=1 Tax=Hypoxylon rubiginosum TaxID=110542 RepID=A0ACB9YXU3_9PEZI|nr:hypothetical protein F4820DRAFT_426624 [Hypoxylon rubiginosum]